MAGAASPLQERWLDECAQHVFLPRFQCAQTSQHSVMASWMPSWTSKDIAASVARLTGAALPDQAKRFLQRWTHGSHENAREKFQDSIRELKSAGESCPLFVDLHNCLVVVTARGDGLFDVSCSRIQPSFKATTTTLPSAIAVYPHMIVRTDRDSLLSPSFAAVLDHFLHNVPEDALAHITKSGCSVEDGKDAVNPCYWFNFILSGLEMHVVPQRYNVRHPRKYRDEVLRLMNQPWRREPGWMAVKTALFLMLHDADGLAAVADPRACYKLAMLEYMTAVCKHHVAKSTTHPHLLHEMITKLSARAAKLEHGHIACPPHITSFIKSTRTKLRQDWHADLAALQPALVVPSRHMFDETCLAQSHLQASSSKLQQFLAASSAVTDTTVPGRRIPGGESRELQLHRKEDAILARILHIDSAAELTAEALYNEAVEHFGRCNLQERDPVVLSRRLLVCFALLAQMDKVILATHPLMAEHKLEVDWRWFELFVLPDRFSRDVLAHLEEYFERRTSEQLLPGICAEELSNSHPALRFFDQSDQLKEQLRAALQREETARQQYRVELDAQYERIAELGRQLQRHRSCDFISIQERDYNGRWQTKSRHSSSCTKCNLTNKINSISEVPFEDWLPTASAPRRSIIFDIFGPRDILLWRELQFRLAYSVLQVTPSATQSSCNRNTASPWNTTNVREKAASSNRELTLLLASSSASFAQTPFGREAKPLVSHRHCKDTTFFLQCGKNARLMVSYSSKLVGPLLPTGALPASTRAKFHFSLSRDASVLQFAMDLATCSENAALAHQHACPENMRLDEFAEFGSVRSAVALQLQHIVRGLEQKTLSFRSPDTFRLLAQVLWQCGPPSDDGQHTAHRKALQSLRHDHPFVLYLLRVANEQLLDQVSDNPQNHYCLGSASLIASLVLSFATADEHGEASVTVRESCLALLHRVRAKILRWIDSTKKRLQELAANGESANVLKPQMQIVAQLALHGLVTFAGRASVGETAIPIMTTAPTSDDADDDILHESELQHFVELLFFSHQFADAVKALPDFDKIVLCGLKQRTVWQMMPSVLAARDSPAFDAAMRAVCTVLGNTSTHTGWQSAPENKAWVETRVDTKGDDDVIVTDFVQFDVVSGMLLVNGLPESRLPRELTDDSDYKRVFRDMVFDVHRTGSTFVSADKINGADFAFRLSSSGALVVTQTVAASGRMFVLVPQRVLEGELPEHLVARFSHWYEPASNQVFFRPVEFSDADFDSDTVTAWPFALCTASWRLVHRSSNRLLFGFQSEVYNAALHLATRLELRQFVHVWSEAAGLEEGPSENDVWKRGDVRIHLPRHDLSFTISPTLDSKAVVRCTEHPGFVVAEEQTIGCLAGLQHFVTLQHEADAHARKILVPHAMPELSVPLGSNVTQHTVNLKLHKLCDNPSLFAFDVNADLGELAAPKDCAAWLFLALLHMATSSVFPDPLTGCPGFVRAVQLIGMSPRLHHDGGFDPRVDLILRAILDLAPKRKFFPKDKQQQAQVTWPKCLPQLAALDSLRNTLGAFVEKFTPVFQSDDQKEEKKLRGNLLKLLQEHSDSFLDTRAQILWRNVLPDDVRIEQMAKVVSKHEELRPQEVSSDVGRAARNAQTRQEPGSWNDRSTVTDLVGSCGSWSWDGCESPHVLNLCTMNFLELFATLRSEAQHPANHFARWGLAWLAHCELSSGAIDALLAVVHRPDAFSDVPMPPCKEVLNGNDFSLEDFANAFRRRGEPQPPTVLQDYGESLLSFLARKQRASENHARIVREADSFEAKAKMQLAERVREIRARVSSFRGQLFETSKLVAGLGSFVAAPSSFANADDWQSQALNFCKQAARCEARNEFARRLLRVSPSGTPHLATVIPSSPTLARLVNTHVPRMLSLRLRAVGEQCSEVKALLESAPWASAISAASGDAEDFEFSGAESELERIEGVSFDDIMGVRSQSKGDSIGARFRADMARSWARLQHEQHESSKQRGDQPEDAALAEKLSEFVAHAAALEAELLQRLTTSYHAAPGLAILKDAGLCAPVTPRTLLPLLLKHPRSHFSGLQLEPSEEGLRARELLLHFAMLLVAKQKARRLLVCLRSQRQSHLQRELSEGLHANWDPACHPEWLLLEIELNVAIRPTQADIAHRMIAPNDDGSQPACCRNTPAAAARAPQALNHSIMQLNMGEGKSTVIVPMVAASLAAEPGRIVRVLAPHSLVPTNTHDLRQTLGGLLGCIVQGFPCRRDRCFDEAAVERLEDRVAACARGEAIFVMSPEEALSFRLRTLEMDCGQSTMPTVLSNMRTIASELQNKARDVMDEADSLLHFKRQLIYTMGTATMPDGGELRWRWARKVLGILVDLYTNHPMFPRDCFVFTERSSIGHISKHHPSFPAELRLIDGLGNGEQFRAAEMMIAKEALKDGELLRGRILTATERSLCVHFLLHEELTDDELLEFMTRFGEDEALCEHLFILRGLFAYGLLRLAISKRWRVNYGVNTEAGAKTQLAVPFQAKDRPMPNTEFGHPDLALLLTELSYSYSGLSLEQLQHAIRLLVQSGNPQPIYEAWLAELPLPDDEKRKFGQLEALNMNDPAEMRQVWELLRFHRTVIAFWLDTAVYRRQARQFPQKLVATPWDLCSESRRQLLTGFSGTNDTQLLLPQNVKQNDLPRLVATNARVISFLLQSQNRECRILGADFSGKAFIDELASENKVQMLIDVGALVMELDNEQVATHWLEKRPDMKAAVFFVGDQLCVRTQSGQRMPLRLSPFEHNLSSCLVYLDEAHTRGVDLRLPGGLLAALTVGRGMTRDKFVQACMRLRQLGQPNGQTLRFYAPAELQDELAQHGSVHGAAKTTTSVAVLRWVLRNSVSALEDGLLYWASQARSHFRIVQAEEKRQPACFCEDDAQPLRDMYGRARQRETMPTMVARWRESVQLPQAVEQRCKDLGSDFELFANLLDEEQERELEAEVEEQRQLERPPPARPAERTISMAVKVMTAWGQLPHREADAPESLGVYCRRYLAPLDLQGDGSLAALARAWGPQTSIFVSEQFATTVEENSSPLDLAHLRPVRWVLTRDPGSRAELPLRLLITPFEADFVAGKIRAGAAHSSVSLQLFMSRRLPMATSPRWAPELMLPCGFAGDVAPDSAPELVQSSLLAIFAGSLYFEETEGQGGCDQARFCALIGACPRPWTQSEEQAFERGVIDRDTFLSPEHRAKLSEADLAGFPAPFAPPSRSVMKLLNAFYANVRNGGNAFVMSDVGHVLSFFKVKSSTSPVQRFVRPCLGAMARQEAQADDTAAAATAVAEVGGGGQGGAAGGAGLSNVDACDRCIQKEVLLKLAWQAINRP